MAVAPMADAHPVSQGALHIGVFPDRVRVQATVSSEEVIVAATHGGRARLSPLEMIRSHGAYLLAHFRLTADGRRLEGRLVTVPERASDRPEYQLEYQVRGGVPQELRIQQDVLREFEFAPGNPWEASYVVQIQRHDRLAKGLLLTSDAALIVDLNRMAAGVDTLRMIGEYVRHGIRHILAGYDHLLFLMALVLAMTTLWDLVAVISAFTLAHSISLTLSVVGATRLPEGLVEPMIAASIVVVALQNVVGPKQSRGAGRLWIAFFFGLFHGLGFAGGLLAAMQGLAGFAAGAAIAAFSAGVEIGHQLVVLPVFFVLRTIRGQPSSGPAGARPRVLRYASAAICVAGIFYLVSALR
jgi:hypothetical protein